MDSEPLALTVASRLGEALSRQGLTLTVAESCTGGMVAAALTAVPGSSRWFGYGFVTYSSEAKARLLGLESTYLDSDHIVSAETAVAMARAARKRALADLAIGVTGIAGPSGGTACCPVGTVAIAWALGDEIEAQTFHFPGDRERVRAQAVLSALGGLETRLTRGLLARP